MTILVACLIAAALCVAIEVAFVWHYNPKPDFQLRVGPNGTTTVQPGVDEPRTLPYLDRWYILRSRVLCLYLHRIWHSDDDRALHDHRSWNVSLLLSGTYDEITLGWATAYRWRRMRAKYPHILACHSAAGWAQVRKRRWPWLPVFRRGDTPHRLEVVRGPVWTLFLTGPDVRVFGVRIGRRWGFHGRRGWVHWRDWEVHGQNAEPTMPEPVGEL